MIRESLNSTWIEPLVLHHLKKTGVVAETKGFEPSRPSRAYSLSRGCCDSKQAPFECSRHPKNTGHFLKTICCTRTSVSSHKSDTDWWTSESLAPSVSDSFASKGVKEKNND